MLPHDDEELDDLSPWIGALGRSLGGLAEAPNGEAVASGGMLDSTVLQGDVTIADEWLVAQPVLPRVRARRRS